MKLIDVSTPKHPNTFVKVDDEDFEPLNQWKWTITEKGYARRRVPDGRRRNLLMHRSILNAASGVLVDHINGDKLDNQRANLRLCTLTENCRNRKPNLDGTSKYRGVGWSKNENKFRARIKIGGGQRVALGYFKSETEAAMAYNEAALKYHGEFARLNIIESTEGGKK